MVDAPGPPSGAFFAGQTINGISFPTPSQPAIGYSGIVAGRTPGEYLAMPDNGFGNKANSRDFELRAYYIEPDWKTASGGSGTVSVGLDDYISNVVSNFLVDRKDDERFADWVARADDEALRGDKVLEPLA